MTHSSDDVVPVSPIPVAGGLGAAGSELSGGGRFIVLAAAFLGWLFAGLEMSNFLLATGAIVRDLHQTGAAGSALDAIAGRWFGWYISAFLLGAATGGLLFGWLGDVLGRAKAMGASILCYSLVTGAGYFAASLEQLRVLRFIACMGIGGMWPTGVALASEAWPERYRPLLAGLIGTAANLGIALMGVVGAVRDVTQHDWRWVMAVSASPAVLGFLVLLFCPESPRWLQYVGSFGASVGSLLGGWLACLFGRRTTYFAISLGSLAMSGAIFWFLSPRDGVLFFTVLFVLRLVSTTYFGWLPLYLLPAGTVSDGSPFDGFGRDVQFRANSLRGRRSGNRGAIGDFRRRLRTDRPCHASGVRAGNGRDPVRPGHNRQENGRRDDVARRYDQVEVTVRLDGAPKNAQSAWNRNAPALSIVGATPEISQNFPRAHWRILNSPAIIVFVRESLQRVRIPCNGSAGRFLTDVSHRGSAVPTPAH